MSERANEYYSGLFERMRTVSKAEHYQNELTIYTGHVAIHSIKNHGLIVSERQLKDTLAPLADASYEQVREQHSDIPDFWSWVGLNHTVENLTNGMLKPVKTGTVERVIFDLVTPDELPRVAREDADRFLKPTPANMNVKFPEAVVYGKLLAELMVGRRQTEVSAGIMLYPSLDKRWINPPISMSVKTLQWKGTVQPAAELVADIRRQARELEGHQVSHPVKAHWKIPD